MLKKSLLFLLLFQQTITLAQLGFCNGSSGAPIFFENFGSGLNYGPALPAGITNYQYVNSGFPQDGKYTLYHRTNLIPNSQNWLFSLDHTPDNEPDGTNGKCLIVNASNVPGQFYNRTVTGLCSNTTFEFSAWVLNILNATVPNGLPINVTFEIWDATDTVLLQSGNTGNINSTFSPVWNQFGLVFTMPAGQTSVILKMRNNGVGGNGNDLAIDDIMFRACGEFSTITTAGTSINAITICENETIANTNLQVTTTGTATNVYQWQQSNDNVTYTDISGETSNILTIPSTLNSTTFYRVKVANDAVNLNNSFCTTISEIFTVNVNPLPNAPVSNGDTTNCSNQTATLEVTVNTNESVDWYDAPTNGTLLQNNSTTYTPTTNGTYYAEAYNTITNCKSNSRTAVTLLPAITVTTSGTTTLCSGQTTAISLTASDNNAILNWTATSTDVVGFANGSGNSINQTLTYAGTTTGTVVYTITPVINGCEGTPETVTITVNPQEVITLTFNGPATSYCINEVAPNLPTSSSNTTPINGTWTPASIDTSDSGTTTYTFNPQTTDCQNIQPFQINITVGNNIVPDFEANSSICLGATPPQLNTTSPNGITGTWNPATIDNTVSGSYTFTPNPSQCAVSQTINISVLEADVTINGPTTLCSGQTTAINLTAADPNTTFSWTATSSDAAGFANGSGNTINQTLTYSGTGVGTVVYAITPNLNGCDGTTETVTLTINPQETIVLTFPTLPTTYCLNSVAPALPTSSSNTLPVNGTWSPATINTAIAGTTTYTFNPQTTTCQNIAPYQITVTILSNVTPNFQADLSYCLGTIPPQLNTTSPNGITGTWNPATINTTSSGSYTFTPNPNQCAVSQTINVTVLEGTLTSISFTSTGAFSENQIVTVLAMSSGSYLYQLDDGDFQQSNVFENVAPGTHILTVIDETGCSQPISDEILIVDYPHFFTPNGDGFNDYWIISGLNSLQNPKVSIFDRYGKLITQISRINTAWDGTLNGQNLPADDYWFTIDYTENNIQKTFKSHFSLSR
jgi:gliding motility-associated-like protein